MIKRPENLVTIRCELTFNYLSFRYLEIDINHVNKSGRSNYTPLEVKAIVKSLFDNRAFSAEAQREFGEIVCSYFVVKGKLENKFIKVIACICSDRPETLGIITCFRIGA